MGWYTYVEVEETSPAITSKNVNVVHFWDEEDAVQYWKNRYYELQKGKYDGTHKIWNEQKKWVVSSLVSDAFIPNVSGYVFVEEQELPY